MSRRFAVLQKVDNAWRVVTEDGPLKDCPWCGLFASREAAVVHAAKHRVDIDARVEWPGPVPG